MTFSIDDYFNFDLDSPNGSPPPSPPPPPETRTPPRCQTLDTLLLGNIFVLLRDLTCDTGNVLAAASVCSHWRAVARTFPAIWTRLYVGRSVRSVAAFPTAIAFSAHARPPLLLSVFMHRTIANWGWPWARVDNALVGTAWRLAKLDVSGDDDAVAALNKLFDRALYGELKELRVVVTTLAPAVVVLPLAPRLSFVLTQGVALAREELSVMWYPEGVFLELGAGRREHSRTPSVDFRGAAFERAYGSPWHLDWLTKGFPHLRILKLNYACWLSPSDGKDRTVVILPLLDELHVSDGPWAVATLLQVLLAPQLRHFTFILDLAPAAGESHKDRPTHFAAIEDLLLHSRRETVPRLIASTPHLGFFLPRASLPRITDASSPPRWNIHLANASPAQLAALFAHTLRTLVPALDAAAVPVDVDPRTLAAAAGLLTRPPSPLPPPAPGSLPRAPTPPGLREHLRVLSVHDARGALRGVAWVPVLAALPRRLARLAVGDAAVARAVLAALDADADARAKRGGGGGGGGCLRPDALMLCGVGEWSAGWVGGVLERCARADVLRAARVELRVPVGKDAVVTEAFLGRAGGGRVFMVKGWCGVCDEAVGAIREGQAQVREQGRGCVQPGDASARGVVADKSTSH
ncbi:uncharacterized protein BXZ73DRAFT_106665 [Epithele typhae]|uniref:uncharacterized protein n=1 Tax=Epithele typhae TaxID=378194 RepID=UPI002007B397|nr:uncharacterized protein BXZ73DRAFT_106665 [Epithele typhae]KAH9914169.1 hypothetical protein BXZ73DRAFT_106665 [Epithele typhae]